MAALRPLRRVLTGFDGDGHSIVLTDDNPEPTYFHPKSSSSIYTVYRTEQTPAKVAEDTRSPSWADAFARYPKFSSENGAVFRSFDYPPGSETPLHCTHTVDFGVVTHGSIELHFDHGDHVVLKAGDTVVQRATQHKWINPTNEWARIVFVVVQAQGPVIDGKKLEDTMQDKFDLAPR